MGKVIVYIATSLDEFIARKDDDICWLDPFNASGEDYGYRDFIKNIGTAVLGGRPYEQSLANPERLLTGLMGLTGLKGLKNNILTSRSLPLAGAHTDSGTVHSPS